MTTGEVRPRSIDLSSSEPQRWGAIGHEVIAGPLVAAIDRLELFDADQRED